MFIIRSVYPTVATYTSVIKCLASCGRLEDAEILLDEMATERVCPSPATYNCFFKEYRGRKDKWREACQFFMEMIEKDFCPKRSPLRHCIVV
ncbi:hypothetical protein ACP70R_018177 [Stipagrostis hirtigluma subsp. patula]